MTTSIRQFWSRLVGCVHPADQPFFDKAEGLHCFNLDFPPPAFIGDIDNARVVILMANGGYNSEKTPLEFQDQSDRKDYVDWLGGRRKDFPRRLSSYYTDQKTFPWISQGSAVILNAIAYRSAKISNETPNRILGKTLPSSVLHRKFLFQELLQSADANEHLIIAHRFRLWGLDSKNPPIQQNLIFSQNPASPYLSEKVKTQIRQWLKFREPVLTSYKVRYD